MKKLMEVVEVEDAGFMSLLGKNVVVFCANYIYTGKLTGVNDTCIELTLENFSNNTSQMLKERQQMFCSSS